MVVLQVAPTTVLVILVLLLILVRLLATPLGIVTRFGHMDRSSINWTWVVILTVALVALATAPVFGWSAGLVPGLDSLSPQQRLELINGVLVSLVVKLFVQTIAIRYLGGGLLATAFEAMSLWIAFFLAVAINASTELLFPLAGMIVSKTIDIGAEIGV
jgi:hypothetical protein